MNREYKLSLFPFSDEDLELLKQELIKRGAISFHCFLELSPEDMEKFQSGLRPDICTIMIKEE